MAAYAMAADDLCLSQDVECAPRGKEETDKSFCDRILEAKKTNPGYQRAYCRFDQYNRLTGFSFRYVPKEEREKTEIHLSKSPSITSIEPYVDPGMQALLNETSFGAPLAAPLKPITGLIYKTVVGNDKDCVNCAWYDANNTDSWWLLFDVVNTSTVAIGLLEFRGKNGTEVVVEPLPKGNSRASGVILDAVKDVNGVWRVPGYELPSQKVVEALPETKSVVEAPFVKPDPASSRFPHNGFLKKPTSGKNKKVGILPGTFDPIHEDHIKLAEKIRAEFDLDEVVLVSNPDPNHKPGATTYEVRSDILASRAEIAPGLNAFSLPIEQAPTTNQALIDYMAKAFPNAEIYQIMGDDVYIKLSQKGKIKADGTNQYIVTRREVNPKDDLNIPDALKNKVKISVYHPGRELSSTAIRNAVKSGQDIPGDQLHPVVQKAIAEQGLYLETINQSTPKLTPTPAESFPASDAYLNKFPNSDRPYLVSTNGGFQVFLRTPQGDYIQTKVKELKQVPLSEAELKKYVSEKNLPSHIERTIKPGLPLLISTSAKNNSEVSRREIMAKSNIQSADVFTNLENVPAEKKEAAYRDPNNWIPERRAFHEELLKKYNQAVDEVSDALKKSEFARENPNQPILVMTRGNSAAGKSSSIKNSNHPIFKKLGITDIMKMAAAKFGILNPDTVKSELQSHDQMLTTSAQEHEEGSMLTDKMLDAALAAKKSIIVDKRFANTKSVNKLAEKAKKSGYRIIMIDVDATISNSAQRLTGRVPGGEDPNVPYEALALGFKEIRRDRLEAANNKNIDDYYAFNNIAGSKDRGLVASRQKDQNLIIHSETGWKEVTAKPDPMEFNLTARKYGDMLSLLSKTRPAEFKVNQNQDTITNAAGEKINYIPTQDLVFHLLPLDIESARHAAESFPKVGNSYSVEKSFGRTDTIDIVSENSNGYVIKYKSSGKSEQIRSEKLKQMKKSYLFTPQKLQELADTTKRKELYKLSALYQDDLYHQPRDPQSHEKFARHFRDYFERYGISLKVEKISDVNYKITISDADPFIRQKFLKNEFFSFQASGEAGHDLVLETADLSWKRTPETSTGVIGKIFSSSLPAEPADVISISKSLDLSQTPKSQIQSGQEIVKSTRWGDYLADLAGSDSLRIIPGAPPLIEMQAPQKNISIKTDNGQSHIVDQMRIDEPDAQLFAAKLNLDQAKAQSPSGLKKQMAQKSIENAKYAIAYSMTLIGLINYTLEAPTVLKKLPTNNTTDFNREFGFFRMNAKHLETRSPTDILKLEKQWLENVQKEAKEVLEQAQKEL